VPGRSKSASVLYLTLKIPLATLLPTRPELRGMTSTRLCCFFSRLPRAGCSFTEGTMYVYNLSGAIDDTRGCIRAHFTLLLWDCGMPISSILSQPTDGPGSFDFTRGKLSQRERFASALAPIFCPIHIAGLADPIPMCRMGFGRTWTVFPRLRLRRCFLCDPNLTNPRCFFS
jgi:hypothetical protein